MIRPRRREFSAKVKRAAHARSGGICECWRIWKGPGCGMRLGAGNIFYEHIICDGIGGDPSLDNCAVLVKTCWKRKTAEYDLPLVAKGKRQHDRNIGIRRSSGRPLSHPYLTRRFDGQVIDRRRSP